MKKLLQSKAPIRTARLQRRAILYLRLFRLQTERGEDATPPSPMTPKTARQIRFLWILCRTLIHLLLPLLPPLIRRIRESDWSSCEAK